MRLGAHYYLLRLDEALQCERKAKRGILAMMKGSLKEYKVDHQKYSFKDLTRYFGTPEKVAAAYWPNGVIPPAKVLTRRIALKIVLGVLVILLALFGVYFLVTFLLQYFIADTPKYWGNR